MGSSICTLPVGVESELFDVVQNFIKGEVQPRSLLNVGFSIKKAFHHVYRRTYLAHNKIVFSWEHTPIIPSRDCLHAGG